MADSVQETNIIQFMILGILIMVCLALALIAFFYRNKRRLLQEAVYRQEQEIRHQERLLYSTIMVQEQERKRIAGDLHDDIGSKLNALSLYIKQLGEDNLKVTQLLPDMQTIIKKTAETTRRISHELSPPTLENFGLSEAIREVCKDYQKSGKVKVHFSVEEDQGRISDTTVELNLFRIVQELLSNSIRHGDADEMTIQLWLSQDQIQLHYRDNGKGFDATLLSTKKGLGMKNIDSRLKMMDAEMEVESAIHEGAQFYIQLPRK